MTTWTPATSQAEAWTAETNTASARLFSPTVFSRALFNGFQVFAVGSSQGVWTNVSAPSSAWTPE